MVFNWKEFNQRPERKAYMKKYGARWRAEHKEWRVEYDKKRRERKRYEILKKKKEYWKKVKYSVNKKRKERRAILSKRERKVIDRRRYDNWKKKENQLRLFLGLPTTDENRKFKNFNQKKLYLLYKSLFPNNDVEIGCYPEWLVNPKTGRKMELDIYDKTNRVVIERDGAQHYRDHDIFNGDSWKNIQQRDRLKDAICRKKRIKIIRIKYNEPHTEEYLIKRLLSLGIECKQRTLNGYLIDGTRKNFSE